MASEKLIDLFKRLEGKFQLKQSTYNQLSRGINSISIGTPDLVEKIFDYLPHKSLSSAECVSRSWNTAIKEGRFWSRKLKQQVSFTAHSFITKRLNNLLFVIIRLAWI